jgi:antitoxin CptB
MGAIGNVACIGTWLSEMIEDVELKRIRWRCRRGMRELDQLMLRYLDQRWQNAPTAERNVFLQLLDSEDDKLWAWFMGRETPEDAQLETIVNLITALPA